MEEYNCSPLTHGVLSWIQAKGLLQAKAAGKEKIVTSLDLGFSQREVRLDSAGISADNQPILTWRQLRAIADSEKVCFRVLNGSMEEIRRYSESTCRTYSLFPAPEAPALMISGFTMHRFKNISPRRAALEMIQAAAPIQGRVLDTATGLGYTAIAAARSAAGVITIEIDPDCLEMARANPWSQELFNHPAIRRFVGDSGKEIVDLPSEHFSIIIHDPPSLSLAGDLYAEAFYRQAWRVLAKNGRMFHYLGDPGSAMGARVTRGVVQRLASAGFRRIVSKPAAHGVLACK